MTGRLLAVGVGVASVLALAFGAIVPGCYTVPEPVCGFACGPNGACPDDYTCMGDSRCHLNGAPMMSCGMVDAAVDAPVVLFDGMPDSFVIPDALPDAMVDAEMIDGAVDAMTDAGVDAVPDAMVDAMADAMTDAMLDAPPDAMVDAAPMIDAMVDAPMLDAPPDAMPDATIVVDSAPDAPDASPPSD